MKKGKVNPMPKNNNNLQCVYCKKKVTLNELLQVDSFVQNMDSEKRNLSGINYRISALKKGKMRNIHTCQIWVLKFSMCAWIVIKMQLRNMRVI